VVKLMSKQPVAIRILVGMLIVSVIGMVFFFSSASAQANAQWSDEYNSCDSLESPDDPPLDWTLIDATYRSFPPMLLCTWANAGRTDERVITHKDLDASQAFVNGQVSSVLAAGLAATTLISVLIMRVSRRGGPKTQAK